MNSPTKSNLDFSTFARHSYEDDNGSIDSDL
jgi:hypothetical protein